MIKCRVERHTGANTITHSCKVCDKIIVRCFVDNLTAEHFDRSCWGCDTKQPAILNLVLNRQDRIEYYKTTIEPQPKPRMVSGIY
jgi:hypothetical protein